MTPYFESKSVTIYHGDCLEVLPTLGPVDAVVTDPPYSSGGQFRSDRAVEATQKYRGWSQDENGRSVAPAATYSAFAGDHRDQRGHLVWCSLWLSACARIAHPGSVVATYSDWRQLPVMSDALQCAGFVWRGIVVWDKGVGRPVSGRFRNHLEYVVWGSLGPMDAQEGEYPSALVRASPPTSHTREHLTQKSVDATAHVLRVCGATVLDPFLGSGTTAVACVKTGRKCIGIELDEGYCEVAARRVQEAESHIFAEAAQ